jgi:hypothetical protein
MKNIIVTGTACFVLGIALGAYPAMVRTLESGVVYKAGNHNWRAIPYQSGNRVFEEGIQRL